MIKGLDLNKLGFPFQKKPILVGGSAMEYYGLRTKGDDFDFIVCNEDYLGLAAKYPDHRKDMWADLGIHMDEFELFRSMWKLDYSFFEAESVDIGECRVISFEQLFLMKVLAMQSGDKHKRDVDLILERFLEKQNPEYLKNMNDNIARYLAAPGGVILNDGNG